MISYERFNDQLNRIFSQDEKLNQVALESLLDAIPRVDEWSHLSEGTTVLVRADIDVPIKEGKVDDVSRIESNSQTIKYCMDRGWKTIIFGHLGRDKSASVQPVCRAMADDLGRPIELVEDWLDEEKSSLNNDFVARVGQAGPGSTFMLQNTRKYGIEQALWKATPKDFPAISARGFKIASDVYSRLARVEINEAIAASNIDFSSSVLPLVMDQTALGFYIAEEMKTHLKGVRKANAVVFSGLKINKLDDLEGIIDRGTVVLVVAAGSLAMALIKARSRMKGKDFFIGLAETDPKQKAYIEPGRIEQAKRMIGKCKAQGIELVLPVDFVLDDGRIGDSIPEGHAQMDIGPATIAMFSERFRRYVEEAKTGGRRNVLFYNGVFGKFEDPKFEQGTKSFIRLLGQITVAGVETYVGGGEGRLALTKYGNLEDVTHAFTCGGTILKSLTDRHIAYLKAMYLQNVDRRNR